MHVQRTTLRTKPHVKVFPLAKDRNQRYVAIYKDHIGYGPTPKQAFDRLIRGTLKHQFTSNI